MGLCCKDLEKLGEVTGILDMDYEKVGFGYIINGFRFCPYCGMVLNKKKK